MELHKTVKGVAVCMAKQKTALHTIKDATSEELFISVRCAK